MVVSDFSILEGQLQDHLGVSGRRVRFVAQATGFTLQIEHSGLKHTLFTQRRSPRVFKNLTLAAAFLKERGVKRFTVVLEERSAAKEGTKTKAGAKTKLKSKSGESLRTFSFDEE
ncbi:hypothetical protein GEV39_24540 [Pseudomonas sp. NY5710]|uniref:hypothetical protein n=1 Tax=Pseudomonas sp. NY5710 TaxID=2662033 RepID=UPI0015709FAF|nr:hypothetical protein [Pseudomonas sp. NY5710]QKL04345.1 hypothetical protein GEV39_24540 [Pseudomonas sp. NY5710]